MGYRQHLPLMGANFSRIIYVVGSAIVIQLYLESLGASPFVISLSEMLFWGAMLLFAPFWGALSDVSGRRKPLIALSIVLAGIAVAGYTLLDGVVAILVLRFLFSVIAVAFPPVALAVVSEKGSQANRSRELAHYNGSRAVGFLVGWGVSGLLVDAVGYDVTYLLFAAMGFVGLVFALRIEHDPDPQQVTVGELIAETKRRWIPKHSDMALRTNGMHYLLGGIFLRKMAIIGIMSLIAVYAVQQLSMSSTLIGFALAMNALAQILFIPVFGDLTDRYGRRKIILAGLILTVPVPLLLYLATDAVFLFAAYFMVGFSFAAFVQGSTAFIGDVAPKLREGEFMGLRKSVQGLAGVCGPLLAGLTAEFYGMQTMLLVMTGLIALSVIVTLIGTTETMARGDVRESFLHDVFHTVYASPE